jgi:hypothetical protein
MTVVFIGVDMNEINERVYEARDRVVRQANMRCQCSKHLGLKHHGLVTLDME